MTEAITELRGAARTFAEIHGADAQDVALAISEAVTNAVVHAYVGRAPGAVRLSGRRHRAHIELTVEDDGPGCRPRPDSPGAGLGLAIIAQVADDVGFAAIRPGTRVQMRFALAGSP